jgi:hypothetical protein
LACSHTIPSLESSAYKASIGQEHFHKEYQITLSDDDTALLVQVSKENQTSPVLGKWTMVYDEGFDINIGDYSFLLFPSTPQIIQRKNSFLQIKKIQNG